MKNITQTFLDFFRIIRVHKLKTIILIVIFLIFYSFHSNATTYLGGEITWTCVGKDSFIFTLKIYRDCNGTQMGAANLQVKCHKTGTSITSVAIPKPTPKNVTPVCGGQCTRCESSFCNFQYGIEEYIYKKLVILSSAGSCCKLVASYSDCCRSSFISTGAANKDFYTEAVFDRCLDPCDNSPVFAPMRYPVVRVGEDCYINQLVTDPDINSSNGEPLDSLSYELAYPLSGSGSNIPYTGQYDYDKPLFFWGFTNEDLPLPRGFHLDPETGSLRFRPMKIQNTVVALKVKAFRNGKLIAEVRRDFSIHVVNSTSNNQPSLSGSKYVAVHPKDTADVLFHSYDPDTKDSLFLDHATTISGYSWTDDNGKVKRPNGTFTWIPGEDKIREKPYLFRASVSDNHCDLTAWNYLLVKIKVVPENIKTQCENTDFYLSFSNPYSSATYLWEYMTPSKPWDTIKHSSVSGTFNDTLFIEKIPISFDSFELRCLVDTNKDNKWDDTLGMVKLDVLPNNIRGFEVSSLNNCYDNSFRFQLKLSGNPQAQAPETYTTWHFGDGNTEKTTSYDVIHRYLNSNKNTVKMFYNNEWGCSDTFTKEIIPAQKPIADFNINQKEQCLSTNEFKFTNTSQNASGYSWDMGDGNIFSNQGDTSYSYNKSGTYHVKLIAKSYYRCTDTLTKKVTVKPSPTAEISAKDTAQCFKVNEFRFTSQSQNADSFTWLMGDNQSYKSKDVTHSYQSPGSYKVKLIAQSKLMCFDTAEQNVTVHPSANAIISVNDSIACFPDGFFTIKNGSSNAQMVELDLGDNSGYAIDTFDRYRYGKPGNFEVRLIVTTKHGCLDTAYQNLAFPEADAQFKVNDSTQCLKDNLFAFTAYSQDSASYFWDMGNNQTLTTKDPAYRYKNAGKYMVKLILSVDSQCFDTFSKQITVFEQPLVDLGKDTSIGYWDSLWLDAGAGFPDYLWNDQSKTRTKKVLGSTIDTGTHSFSVTVTDSNGCKASDSIIIYIMPSGIKQFEADKKVYIYPNPNNGSFTITILGAIQSEKHLTIFDTRGKIVYDKFMESNPQQLQLSGLAKGMYILRIQIEGAYISRKLMVH